MTPGVSNEWLYYTLVLRNCIRPNGSVLPIGNAFSGPRSARPVCTRPPPAAPETPTAEPRCEEREVAGEARRAVSKVFSIEERPTMNE